MRMCTGCSFSSFWEYFSLAFSVSRVTKSINLGFWFMVFHFRSSFLFLIISADRRRLGFPQILYKGF